MTYPPTPVLLEPQAVAAWLETDVAWVHRSILLDGLPVLGYRTDGTPLMVIDEIRVWLRRPRLDDDCS